MALKNWIVGMSENEDYIIYNGLEELDEASQWLVNKANEALETSYSPYSKFTVGAAALLNNSEVILGSNQENASYPAGLCAERVALFQAGARFPHAAVIRLAIVAKRANEENLRAGGPCGMCRQVMLEFEQKFNLPYEVIFRIEDGKWIKTKSAQILLPFSFGKHNL
ncbi:cytidine deaminase [Fulvivirga sp.]|uniref:cytidine deaminase n=1 Tax=Fulvivirga sp. TaxID=1931237 RepID=UPI0032EC51CA